MRHRSIVGVFILVVLLARGVFAEEPQLAYRILSSYVDQRQADSGAGRRVAGTVMTVAGGLMVGAAAATWFQGEEIAMAVADTTLDPDLKLSLSLGLGLGGLVSSGIGIGILVTPPRDWRVEFGDVFDEGDPVVQEALAVAALKDLAVSGRNERVRGAVANLLSPVLYAAVRAGINLGAGKGWSEGVLDGLSVNIFSIVGGVSSLFGSSEGERLYEKYLAGREALYGPTPRIGG